MKEADKVIVEKMVKVATKNLYSVISEFESLTGLEFEVASDQDVATLLNMMHGAIDLVIPVLNEAKKEVAGGDEVCIFTQE